MCFEHSTHVFLSLQEKIAQQNKSFKDYEANFKYSVSSNMLAVPMAGSSQKVA